MKEDIKQIQLILGVNIPQATKLERIDRILNNIDRRMREFADKQKGKEYITRRILTFDLINKLKIDLISELPLRITQADRNLFHSIDASFLGLFGVELNLPKERIIQPFPTDPDVEGPTRHEDITHKEPDGLREPRDHNKRRIDSAMYTILENMHRRLSVLEQK